MTTTARHVIRVTEIPWRVELNGRDVTEVFGPPGGGRLVCDIHEGHSLEFPDVQVLAVGVRWGPHTFTPDTAPTIEITQRSGEPTRFPGGMRFEVDGYTVTETRVPGDMSQVLSRVAEYRMAPGCRHRFILDAVDAWARGRAS